MEWEGFPFYYGSGSDRKGAVKAEWDDSALLQILTDIETDTAKSILSAQLQMTQRQRQAEPKVSKVDEQPAKMRSRLC